MDDKKIVPKKSKRLNARDKYWSQGFFCACAITVRNHGCTTEVEDTLKCNYMSIAEMRRRCVDEYDIEILEPLIKEIERSMNR